MFPLVRRRIRADRLLRAYLRHKKAHSLRGKKRATCVKRLKQLQPPILDNDGQLEELSELSDLGTLSDLSAGPSEEYWDEIIGSDWRASSVGSATSASIGTWDSDDSNVPILFPRDTYSSNSNSDSDSDSDSDSEVESLSGMDGDDEEESSGEDSEREEDAPRARNYLRSWINDQISDMYETRYEQPRNELPRGPAYIHHVLQAMKAGRIDHFRQALRVTPLTFEKIVAKIIDDPVFSNNSNNAQISVEEQLAVTLYRFGHDGNASGLQSVANWAGLGKGTVHLVTRRVMTAILRPGFMEEAVRFPTPEEKEMAKQWVESHSCKAWRDGWCLVDGTLVPLAERPHWFGASYFDRKSNYSLTFQVCRDFIYRLLLTFLGFRSCLFQTYISKP